jgi:glutamate-1-semialdehyde 2,1-aminomutase
VTTRSGLSFAESQRLFAEALKVVAGGTTQAKSPENYIPGAYPIYVRRGRGAHLWDVDGNRFVDWILAYGTVVLGYAEPAVDEAAINEIREGFAFPLTRPIQNRLAELIVEIVPSAELVHFFKAGSDSTSAAVRVARIFTGRDKIIRWGYTGWHDWACPKPAGIPQKVREDVVTFRYNDLNSLEDALKKNRGQVACVIMMPLEIELPQPGFLQGCKDLAHQYDALFVFDEMRSGFRMSLGGAQEYYAVIPDMATFSKAIANGYAISVLVGRRDIMASLKQTHVSSTFYTNSIAMAAAVATLERLRQGDVIPHLWQIGQAFLDGLNQLARDNGVEAQAVGVAPMPYLVFTYDSGPTLSQTGQIGTPSGLNGGSRNEKAWRTFYTETTRGGVLLHPNHHWFASAAHTQADLDQTLAVCADAFTAVRRAI